MLREEYLDYFEKEVELGGSEKLITMQPEAEQKHVSASRIPEVATGILEIPLGDTAKKGDICYSGEIMHGLGKGNVYVDIGYEYIS